MIASFAQVLDTISEVEGWLSSAQAARLYTAAANCGEGASIVEIGSFRGRSTIVLATAAPEGVTVTAIDPHAGNDRGPQELDGFEAEADDDNAVFLRNLATAGVASRVTHLRGFSAEVASNIGPIDVLYVDGAHRYRPARDDIAVYGAKVVPGGVLLIHDSFSSLGVTLAIGRLLMFGGRFRYVGRAGSLAEYRADLGRTPGVRLRNSARQAAQLAWFSRNLAMKCFLAGGGSALLRRLGRRVPDWPY
jgi:SAM-dependent methyltransferase